jgi:hypothetical protein
MHRIEAHRVQRYFFFEYCDIAPTTEEFESEYTPCEEIISDTRLKWFLKSKDTSAKSGSELKLIQLSQLLLPVQLQSSNTPGPSASSSSISTSSDMETSSSNAFEERRNANIRRNNEFIELLGISSSSGSSGHGGSLSKQRMTQKWL